MTESSGSSTSRNIIIAIIGLIGTTITTIGVITSGVLSNGTGNDGGGNNGGGNSKVTYTIEVAADPNFQAEAEVTIDGHNVGTIFTHQEPHQLTESTSAGQHSYTLKVIIYSGTTAQYCEVGQDITGSGNISVQEGDAFEVFVKGQCSEVYLNEMN